MEIPKPPNKTIAQPPSAVDLEEVVLGAILIDSKGLPLVFNILKPEMFYLDKHRSIYASIVKLHEKGIPIDLLTLSDQMKKESKLAIVGGDYYLISLTQRVGSSAHIEFHAQIIIQKYVLREIIRINDYMKSHSYHTDPDIFDMLEYNEHQIARLKSAINIDGVAQLSPEDELKEKMSLIMQGRPSGIHMFVAQFDDWCGGFQNRELVIIAARPGMGKTTIIISISFKLVFSAKTPVAFFSLEMSKVDLMNRYASIVTGIPFSKIREGKVDAKQFKEITNAFAFIRKNPLFINEDKYHYLIMDKIKKLVKEHGVKIVFIDYVQLVKITENTKDATAELRTITRDLKSLANSLNIPIVILSQLDRSIDSRHDKRPLLNDLKMSGSLEEDADTIMFPFRPAYYKRDVTLPLKEMGRVELDIAKGRSIGTNQFECHLDVFKYEFISMNDFEQ